MIYEPAPAGADTVSRLVEAWRSAGCGPHSAAGDRARRRAYSALRWVGAGLFGAVVIGLLLGIGTDSALALAHSGLGFVWSGTWNPAADQYGAGILVVGTRSSPPRSPWSSSVPIGLGTAVFLSELAPRWIAGPLARLIELLAAVPSIVVGLWALLVLLPVFANHVEPFLHSVPVLGWLFRGAAYGPSILLASVVLAVMTLPTMVALSRTALPGSPSPTVRRPWRWAPPAGRWSARWSSRGARSGISRGGHLGGRASPRREHRGGHGDRQSTGHAPLADRRPGPPWARPSSTSSPRPAPGIGTSSVIALGAVLLLLTVAVNAGGQALLRRRAAPWRDRRPRSPRGAAGDERRARRDWPARRRRPASTAARRYPAAGAASSDASSRPCA